MSELVKVLIKGVVMTSQYGTLSDGDVLTCTPEFAKHLVDDCKAGEYIKEAEAKAREEAEAKAREEDEAKAREEAEAKAREEAEAKAREEAEAKAREEAEAKNKKGSSKAAGDKP